MKTIFLTTLLTASLGFSTLAWAEIKIQGKNQQTVSAQGGITNIGLLAPARLSNGRDQFKSRLPD